MHVLCMSLRRYVLRICYDLIAEKLHYTTATQRYDAYITVPFFDSYRIWGFPNPVSVMEFYLHSYTFEWKYVCTCIVTFSVL